MYRIFSAPQTWLTHLLISTNRLHIELRITYLTNGRIRGVKFLNHRASSFRFEQSDNFVMKLLFFFNLSWFSYTIHMLGLVVGTAFILAWLIYKGQKIVFSKTSLSLGYCIYKNNYQRPRWQLEHRYPKTKMLFSTKPESRSSEPSSGLSLDLGLCSWST